VDQAVKRRVSRLFVPVPAAETRLLTVSFPVILSGNVEYKLSQHAQDVLEEREIPIPWLERVLNSPARIETDGEDPALEHRLGRIQENGNRVLRVVVNNTVRPPRVVTLYFDRTMRNKL
jgi:hypothetical protein